jgi:hypothetical protein
MRPRTGECARASGDSGTDGTWWTEGGTRCLPYLPYTCSSGAVASVVIDQAIARVAVLSISTVMIFIASRAIVSRAIASRAIASRAIVVVAVVSSE